VIVGDDEWDVGNDVEGAFLVQLAFLVVVLLLVVEAEHGDARAKNVHGTSVLGSGLKEVDDPLRKSAMTTKRLDEGIEFGLGRELAPVKQVEHLLEGAVLDEVVDGVSEVGKLAFGSLDVRESGFVGDDSLESFGCESHVR